MFEIAICDDDKDFCQQFKTCLENILLKFNMEYHITVWYKGNDLLEYLMNKNRIDLLFLDILLTDSNGVNIGKFIREHLFDFQMQLVYISVEQGYAMQLFETEPMDFLVKPIYKEQVLKVLNRFFLKNDTQRKIFVFKEERGDAKISYESIWYFQSMNHKVLIHTTNGQREFYGKLSEVELVVPNYFIRIHKSYLVNEHYISRFHYDKVLLRNGQKLTISKSYRTMVQERVRHHLSEL